MGLFENDSRGSETGHGVVYSDDPRVCQSRPSRASAGLAGRDAERGPRAHRSHLQRCAVRDGKKERQVAGLPGAVRKHAASWDGAYSVSKKRIGID